MNLPPEYPPDDENGLRGLIVALSVCLAFYAVMTAAIYYSTL